jgi:hypothetical protein
MRKFLFLLVAVLLIAIDATAQRVEVFRNASGIAFDTVSNTGSKALATRKVDLFYDLVAIQVDIEKVSGTVAGTALIQGSLDNSNWVNIDTLSPSNVDSQAFIKVIDQYPYSYLRVSYTGAGTMAAIIRARALYKRRDLK